MSELDPARQEELERIEAWCRHMFEHHPHTLNLAIVGACSLVFAVAMLLKFLVTGEF